MNRPNWQCFLAGSSKTAPRILIFSIAMGADYSFKLIFIETYAPQFIGHKNKSIGSVAAERTKIWLWHWIGSRWPFEGVGFATKKLLRQITKDHSHSAALELEQQNSKLDYKICTIRNSEPIYVFESDWKIALFLSKFLLHYLIYFPNRLPYFLD